MWSSPDILGLFSINVVSFSRNVVLSGPSFSLNSVSKPRMLSVLADYVLSSLQIIIFDFEVNDGADPGESVGKDPEQSAIAQAGVGGCLNRVEKLLDFAFDECRRFPFGPRKPLGLDFPGRIHGQNSFFGEPGKQHPDCRHVLFDRGRRRLAIWESPLSYIPGAKSSTSIRIFTALSPAEH
jgi:hypothetical protein